jgi:hypothetical protein
VKKPPVVGHVVKPFADFEDRYRYTLESQRLMMPPKSRWFWLWLSAAIDVERQVETQRSIRRARLRLRLVGAN